MKYPLSIIAALALGLCFSGQTLAQDTSSDGDSMSDEMSDEMENMSDDMSEDMEEEMAEEVIELPDACYLAEVPQDTENRREVLMSALNSAYGCFEDQLLNGYAQSRHMMPALVPDWDRASESPFIYDEVGERYLVVYGNDRAVGEDDTLWLDRDFPIGATVAAASFSLSDDRQLVAEPLMLYEKMTQGYSFARGNWRQTMIGPDGAILGVTNGPGADDLTVCAECSARSADRLYLALLNDGVMPANAPEPGIAITSDDFLSEESPLSPSTPLAPTDSLAPLDPSAPLAPLAPLDGSTQFDPNAAIDSEPLAPSEGLAPLAPLDPLAPLEPLAPLDPDSSSSVDPLLQDQAALEPEELAIPESADALEPLPELEGETAAETVISILDLQLADADDPLLDPVDSSLIDVPPLLEAPITDS